MKNKFHDYFKCLIGELINVITKWRKYFDSEFDQSSILELSEKDFD
jgi:hypothetical protein